MVRKKQAHDKPKAAEPVGRMPVIFAVHGAPVLLDDAEWTGELAAWAAAMPKPSSIPVGILKRLPH